MSASITLYDSVRQGSSITVSAVIEDFSGALINPDSHSLEFRDPDGVLRANPTNPTNDSLGHFHYAFQVPATAEIGVWVCKWKATKNSIPSISYPDFNFNVVP